MKKAIRLLLLSGLLTAILFAQGTIRGTVTDAGNNQPLPSVNISVLGTNLGTVTNENGEYSISVNDGVYSLKASALGYAAMQKQVTITGGDAVINFSLTESAIQVGEVIVEVNRAKDRETPVAFTNISKEKIEERIYGQDAPLLLKGTPGLYAFSTDGVGNGEAKLFVRGFNQNYVQVLINGIPTNDPESNSVYWSNWGSVSSAAASVQVQRGAGSSLYGAGSFGGSFNIVTGEAKPRASYGANFSLGDPVNTMYGVDLNTGLIDDMYAFSFRFDRKVGEGNRLGARYEGYNYYFSGSMFFNEQQSLKVVLHGAPQEHGYSFSNDISYFKYFDFKANSAPWLPIEAVNGLPVNPNDGLANYGLKDGRRELVTDEYATLAHNHFHKPQAELHYNHEFSDKTALRATFFYSLGRGGGSSLNGAGNVSNILRAADGSITNPKVADTLYLKNAYQRDSYSLHQQWGILSNYEFQPMENLKLTTGIEYRSWSADHPGHYTNLYGKTSITAQQYGLKDSAGGSTSTSLSFRRRTYQGDVSQESDMAIFGWDLSSTDPTYRSQYRNYLGETPQYTLFANATYNVMENLSVSGTLQYVWYKYTLKENMPSENAIGKRLTVAEKAARGLGQDASKEGPSSNGKFLMAEYASSSSSTITNWYEFELVDAERSRGFIQPKIGANYNVNENINVFGNYSHVERFVDLGVYYNQGRLNPDAKDEISNQYEIGVGWTSEEFVSKFNIYTMTWDNKSARITDQSQAGQPGYDRNGNKTILVGTADYQGIEFEISSRLGVFAEVLTGLEVRGSATISSNKWTSVLNEAKVLGGKRAVFNAGGRNALGATDTLFVDELKDTHVGGPPQIMGSVGFTYRWSDFFVGFDANYYDDHYGLDGDTYVRVDGNWDAGKTAFTYIVDQKLPSRTVFDMQAGYKFVYAGINGMISGQILNLLDTEYLADVDNFGVIPGGLRSYRLNIGIGL
ncbi:MAG: TonB-dependent receptor [Bacteroidota bacterium]